MKLTTHNLQKCLSKIDYSIFDCGYPNKLILDNKGKITGIELRHSSMYFVMKSGIKTVATLGSCTIKMMGKDTVCIGNNKMFVQLHNFDKV